MNPLVGLYEQFVVNVNHLIYLWSIIVYISFFCYQPLGDAFRHLKKISSKNKTWSKFVSNQGVFQLEK